jgi:serine/threonine-protein kinase HipA
MRVGRNGADSTLANALSEHRAFALTAGRAREICVEVSGVVDGWRAHFAAHGVSATDLDLLSKQIDRKFLLEQREDFR